MQPWKPRPETELAVLISFKMPLGRKHISIHGICQCQAKQDVRAVELSLGGWQVQPSTPLPIILVQELASMRRFVALAHERGPEIYATGFLGR